MKTITFWTYNGTVEPFTAAAARAIAKTGKRLAVLDLNFESPVLTQELEEALKVDRIKVRDGLIHVISEFEGVQGFGTHFNPILSLEDGLFFSIDTPVPQVNNLRYFAAGNVGHFGKTDSDYWEKTGDPYVKKVLNYNPAHNVLTGIVKALEKAGLEYTLLNAPAGAGVGSGIPVRYLADLVVFYVTPKKGNLLGTNQILLNWEHKGVNLSKDVTLVSYQKLPEKAVELVNTGLKKPYEVHPYDLHTDSSIIKLIAPELVKNSKPRGD